MTSSEENHLKKILFNDKFKLVPSSDATKRFKKDDSHVCYDTCSLKLYSRVNIGTANRRTINVND